MIRLGMVRRVEIELPVCSKEECEDHPLKQWPVLNQICNHLASNLEEIIIDGAECIRGNRHNRPYPWISIFARERMEQGITICMAWPGPEPNGQLETSFDFHLSAATSESGLINLLTRTVRGERCPAINIYGAASVEHCERL